MTIDELIATATPDELHRLCAWFWRFFTGPLGRYINEAEWVRAARSVMGR